jgi:hypothetical protein
MAAQKPVRKFTAGAVSSAIWENEIVVQGKTVRILKATVERRYKDASGTWKSSTSFGRNEIPMAIYCLQKAFEIIIEHGNAQYEEGTPNEDDALV